MEEVKRKGQFFIIATVIIIAMLMSLISAFQQAGYHIPETLVHESLLEEYRLAFLNNASIDDLGEFARMHGIRSIVATTGNGITIHNHYGGKIRAVVIDNSGNEYSSIVSTNHTFSISGYATVFIHAGRQLISFPANTSRQGVISHVFVENPAEKGYLKSIYIRK